MNRPPRRRMAGVKYEITARQAWNRIKKAAAR